jgi:hypothetical protein
MRKVETPLSPLSVVLVCRPFYLPLRSEACAVTVVVVVHQTDAAELAFATLATVVCYAWSCS